MSSAKLREAYFTKPSEASHLVKEIEKKKLMKKCNVFVEPSIGGGVFVEFLPKDKEIIGYDIEPKVPLRGALYLSQGDYLQKAPKSYILQRLKKRLCVVGNPPFTLAERFFNVSAEFSRVIAMIFPIRFTKAKTQNKLNRHFHLEYQHILDSTFDIDGQNYQLKTVMQIWVKKTKLRKLIISPAKATIWTKVNKAKLRPSFIATNKHILVRRTGTVTLPAIIDPIQITKIVQKDLSNAPKKQMLNYFFYEVKPGHSAEKIAKTLNKYYSKYKDSFISGKGKRFTWNESNIACALQDIPPAKCIW